MQQRFTFLLTLLLGWMALTQLNCLPEPDPREKIMELRVLGIKADPPTAKPGDNVEVSALVVIHTDETIELEWFLCKSVDDVEHGCHEKNDAVKIGKGSKANFVVPADALQKVLTPAEKLSGRFLPITMVARAGKETVVATKRIVVSNSLTNQNPRLVDLAVSDEKGTALSTPWSVSLEKKYGLVATTDDKSRETYQRVGSDGKVSQANERLYLSWYLTDGGYTKGYLSNADDLSNTLETPKEAPKSGTIKLFLILRDGRGGIDWKTFETTVQ